MKNQARIEVIKNKIEELKALDSGYAIMGAQKHQYKFHPTLSRSAIQKLEAQYDIQLSEEYKDILQFLGNGGAGGGYGLERIQFDHVDKPYMGTQQLLRNRDDPSVVDCNMVQLNEISGYIKLFDYGCGMEYGLIVKGEDIGDLIFFDSDGRFEKIVHGSILTSYERWLAHNLAMMHRVKFKLETMPLQCIIDSEWKERNFSVKEILLSLMHAPRLIGSCSGDELQQYLKEEYHKWQHTKQKMRA